MTNQLTADKRDLAKLEAAVIRAAFEGGRALRAINDRKLYLLGSYETMADYCQARFGFGLRNAQLKIQDARVYDILEAHKVALLPTCEAQTRPLHKEANEDVPEIWASAVKLAGENRVTEAIVEQAVKAWYTSDDEPIEATHEPCDDDLEPEQISTTVATEPEEDDGEEDEYDEETPAAKKMEFAQLADVIQDWADKHEKTNDVMRVLLGSIIDLKYS